MTDKYISQYIYCTAATPFCPRLGVVEIIMLIKQVSSAVLPLRPSLQHLHNYNFLYLLPNCLLPTFILFLNADPGLCTLCLLFFHLHPCLGAAARSWCARRVNGNEFGRIYLRAIFSSRDIQLPNFMQCCAPPCSEKDNSLCCWFDTTSPSGILISLGK